MSRALPPQAQPDSTQRLPEPAIGAEDVLQFWLEDGIELGWPSRSLGTLWFAGGDTVDQQIRDRFGALVYQALGGGLTEWEAKPLSRLALVLLLDQFTRNMFRGEARAFSGDLRAQVLAIDALGSGMDSSLPLVGQVFLTMPLMHAEDLALQHRCVARFENLQRNAPPEHVAALQGHLDSAREHRDIIARLGRFPHRNKALGRAMSEPEFAYLATGNRFGQ